MACGAATVSYDKEPINGDKKELTPGEPRNESVKYSNDMIKTK